MLNKYSRREFIVWSGTVASVSALPVAINAATRPSTAHLSDTTSFGSHSQQVHREFILVNGQPRTYIWACSDGSQPTLLTSPGTSPDKLEISSPREFPRTHLISDFSTGQPQENIRRTFGHQVLEEVLQEVEHYSI